MFCAITRIGILSQLMCQIVAQVSLYQNHWNYRLLVKALNQASNFLSEFREPDGSWAGWFLPLNYWLLFASSINWPHGEHSLSLSLSLALTPTCASTKFTARRLRYPSVGVESAQRTGEEEPRLFHSPCPGSWLSPSGRRSSRSGRTGGSSSAAPALCTRRGVEHFLTEKAAKWQLEKISHSRASGGQM